MKVQALVKNKIHPIEPQRRYFHDRNSHRALSRIEKIDKGGQDTQGTARAGSSYHPGGPRSRARRGILRAQGQEEGAARTPAWLEPQSRETPGRKNPDFLLTSSQGLLLELPSLNLAARSKQYSPYGSASQAQKQLRVVQGGVERKTGNK